MPRASQTRIMRTPPFGDCEDCDIDGAGDAEGAGGVEMAGETLFRPELETDGLTAFGLGALAGCSLCSIKDKRQ